MKRENFYRRSPSDALSGMVGMSLEERGVYNTIIDLLYLTWRPLEDSRAYIAGHCGCAVQKLNPIIASLIAKRKLVRFEENGAWYLSNPRFETERTEVKGDTGNRSGRGEVGEKSASVGKNPPTCQEIIPEKQAVTALDKTRVEKKETPIVPSGDEQPLLSLVEPAPPDEVQTAFDLWNDTASRCNLARAKDLTPSRRRAIRKRLDAGGLDGWRAALGAVEVSRFCRGMRPGRDQRTFKADIDFVCQPKSFQRLREGFYGEDIARPGPKAPDRPRQDPWDFKVQRYVSGSRYWNDAEDGPRPGRDGCLAPTDILARHGFGGDDTVVPFPGEGRAVA